MNKILAISLLASISLGLTPVERKLVISARDKARAAQIEYDKSRQSAIDGWDYATRADAHAFETDQKLSKVESDIKISHDNEVALKAKVDKYEPFYVEAHRLWGIKGIIMCVGILSAHLLILIGSIIVLALILWALSFLPVFAVLKIPVQIVGRLLRSIRDRITKKNK